ncbi:MAG: LptF/LptG family permease [Verrucomicrobia bacterium]|nr:LptF/LptG family permease [Verrucomicrobiota bacterium]
MNLLDRHIFTSVLLTCAAAVGLFSFVVALPNVVKDLLGPLLAGQLTPDTFLRLVVLIFPFAISFALPMGMLTGVLLTLGRLSADSEITAMRASGISVARVARPVLVLGALSAAVALCINFESMPWARVQYHRELAAAARTNPLSFIVPKTFIRDFKGTVIYVGEKEGPVLRDIWLWELDDQRRVKRLVRAESGRLDYDEATNSLIPTLVRAKTEERDPRNPEDFSKSPKAPSVGKVEEVRISLDRLLGQDLVREKREWLTYAQLRAEQSRLAAAPHSTPEQARAQTDELIKTGLIVQEKFNLSLAVFSFALIGVPLGIKVSRRETSANLGLALVLVLCFYLLTLLVKWLDRHPEYRPDLLIWLPNLLFLGFGVWLFRRIEK